MSNEERPVSTTARCRRFVSAVVALVIAVTIAAPSSASAFSGSRPLERLLTDLWTEVLETPEPENPFGTGTDVCWEMGPGDRIVSPFGPSGADACTVERGTPLFVVVSSLECSDVEGNGDTADELAACPRGLDQVIVKHELRVDGRRVPVRQVETDAFGFTLPADNLFGVPAGTTGTSVAFGWVVLLPPRTRRHSHLDDPHGPSR